MKIFTEKYRKELLTVLVVLFLFIILGVFYKDFINGLDIGLLGIVRSFEFNELTMILKQITNMSAIPELCVVSMLIILIVKNKEIGLLVSVNLGMVTVLNYCLKTLFNRQRPLEFMLIDQTGYSFPSGHSMISIAFYGFLIYLLEKYLKFKYIRKSAIIFLSLLIALIGFSRVYLGVHYPSDVIVGFYLGYVYLLLFIKFIENQKYLN